MDYDSEQQMEMEALEAIFMDDLQVIRDVLCMNSQQRPDLAGRQTQSSAPSSFATRRTTAINLMAGVDMQQRIGLSSNQQVRPSILTM